MKLKSAAIPLLGLALAGLPAFAFNVESKSAQPARPGTINYIEGSASIDGQTVAPNQAGSVDLEAGQELTTGTGKAEILLTPGVFLRVGDNSSVKLVSPDLMNTQVEIEKGRAGIEVDQLYKQNNLQILDNGVTTRLAKNGYYEFDAASPEVMVFSGKADVELAGGKSKNVKANHEAALQSDLASFKTTNIEENREKDDLYNWSRLRSHYLAEANNEMAPYYADEGYAPGWYWNPYGYGYTFIGAGPFFSPFGWGFYPLGWGGGWGGGWYGGGWGYYGAPYRGHRFAVGNGARGDAVHSFAGARPSAGFHGGTPGGFHGGMAGGGFSGGMGGSGFHGGAHR